MSYPETLRCDDCGRHHQLDAVIPSDIWNKIASDVGLLCIDCIDARAVKHGVTFDARFYWTGQAGSSYLYDDERPSPDVGDAGGEVERALRLAITWFDEYAALHRAKGTSEGNDKGQRNQCRADQLRAALSHVGDAGLTIGDIDIGQLLACLDLYAAAQREQGEGLAAELTDDAAKVIRALSHASTADVGDQAVERMAMELSGQLDALVNKSLDSAYVVRVEGAQELRQWLWDNKVGILRVMQALAAIAAKGV